MPVNFHTAAAVAESQPPDAPSIGLQCAPTWLYNLRVLWLLRIVLFRVAGIACVISVALAFIIPKVYTSQARIMPPETSGSDSALLAGLAGRAMGNDALNVLAMSLMGGRNNGTLFVDLLQSSSVSSGIIDRFQLLSVYHKRYRIDAAKVLARRTRIAQDKKSGVITISVQDTDPVRARDLAQAYLNELNVLVIRASRSSAHEERIFIEQRLSEVEAKLSQAQAALSEFSSSHTAVDLNAQARATVESEAKAQGELIAARSELDSLKQLYGEENVRVRAAQARIASLERELGKMGGSSAPLTPTVGADADATMAFVPLRQVPRLAVPYANLYRQVQVQETVYTLLTQQYEIARIQEARDVPVVNVIDAPGIPEKKSFPPRALFSLGLTVLTMVIASFSLLAYHHWRLLDSNDARRVFAREVSDAVLSLREKMRKGEVSE